MQRFEELKQYKGKEGHCNVPQRYSENKQLRVWVSIQRAQRRLFKEGKQSSMTEDRISALESIGFVWEVISKESWMQFQKLKQYKAKEGHSNVLRNYSENKQSAEPVDTNRATNRVFQEGKQSKMTEDKKSALVSIGLALEQRYNDNWMHCFQELKQYKAKEEHCNVPRKYSENKQLGTWVSTQRSQYRCSHDGKQTR